MTTPDQNSEKPQASWVRGPAKVAAIVCVFIGGAYSLADSDQGPPLSDRDMLVTALASFTGFVLFAIGGTALKYLARSGTSGSKS